MKKIVVVMMMVAMVGVGQAAEEKMKITVKGMVCSFCSQGITKKFKEEKSVKKVDVNLDDHLVTLVLNDGQKLEDAKVEKILKDAGYGVEQIIRGE